MKDRDEIKDLFQQELGNYQAKVNPNLWQGVQAGITSAGTTAAAGTTISLLTKVAIGTGIAAAVTVGTIFLTKSDEKPAIVEEKIEQKIEDSSTTEKISILEEKPLKTIENDSKSIKNDKNSSNSVQNTPISEETSPVTIEMSAKPTEAEYSELKTENQFEPIIELAPIVEEKIQVPSSETREVITETVISYEELVEIEIVKQDNQEVYFTASNIPENAEVRWSFWDGTFDTNVSPKHFYYKTGNYDVKLEVKIESEIFEKTMLVFINIPGKIKELPNIFTPNGDGRNDEFFVETENIETFELTVMDAYQNVVYTTNDPNFRWDGMDRNGQPVKDGNYVYVIVAVDYSGNGLHHIQDLSIRR